MRAAACFLFSLSFATAQIHVTPMAGRWFPADAAALSKSLAGALQKAQGRAYDSTPRPGLVALIAPHAGIEYSGAISAAAFRLAGTPKNILLLAFSHSARVEGVVIPRLDSYSTPAGTVKVDRDVARELGFPFADEKALCDHALENQLPWLRKFAPDATVVPIYVGETSARELEAAARKIAARSAKGDLIVVSSDFTHHGRVYGYAPFASGTTLPGSLRERAMEAFEQIGSLNLTAFDRFIAETGDTICGREPIRLLLAALARSKEKIFLETADMQMSGEITGDWTASVTYGALAFYKDSAFTVAEPLRRRLVSEARATIEAYYAGAKPASASRETDGALNRRSGLFVTLRKQGELRGCIGTLSPRLPILATLADRTLAAARSDPRFRALSREEGPVSIEISLLTPIKRIFDWREFQTGQGALLMLGENGGLLLPQVAREMHWDREQFLEGLSQKAGLAAKSYRDPKAKLYVFEAQVFGE